MMILTLEYSKSQKKAIVVPLDFQTRYTALELNLEDMKIIGDRLLSTEAKSIETVLLKFRAAHSTALRSLPEGDAVRNLLASTIHDMDQLEL